MMFKSIVEESSELSDNEGVGGKWECIPVYDKEYLHTFYLVTLVHNTTVPNLTCLPALLYLLQILSQSTCESRYCLFIISHEWSLRWTLLSLIVQHSMK